MQLRSVFHKTVKRNKLKVWKFQSHGLSSFSAINKKTVTEVEGGEVISFYQNCRFIFFYRPVEMKKILGGGGGATNY